MLLCVCKWNPVCCPLVFKDILGPARNACLDSQHSINRDCILLRWIPSKIIFSTKFWWSDPQPVGIRSFSTCPKPSFHCLFLPDHRTLAAKFITALEQEIAFVQIIPTFYPLPKWGVFPKPKVMLLNITCVVQLFFTHGYHLSKDSGSCPELQVTLVRNRWRELYLGKLREKSSNLNMSLAVVLFRGWDVRRPVSLEKMD